MASFLATIMVLLIATAIAYPLYLSSQGANGGPPEPLSLNDIISRSKLAGGPDWEVIVLRRSGYVYSTWNVTGNREAAMNLAISKLKKARIETVAMVRNEPTWMEVAAYYESGGQRRTGQYVGGFVVKPLP